MSGDSNDAQAWSGSGLAVGNLRSAVLDRLTRSLGKDPRTATPRNFYVALSLAAREELTARWLATQRRIRESHAKRVCYLSVEFLPGRSLVNALSSLDGGLVEEARRMLADHGLDLDDLVALLAPRRMAVEADFRVRGGIHTVVEASHP